MNQVNAIPGPLVDQGQLIMDAYMAAFRVDEVALAALVLKGVDLDYREGWTSEETRWTLLHLAATEGLQRTVELLVKKGANKEVKDDFGLGPLHLAAREGHTNVVEALLNLGADPSALSNDEKTVFHYAAESGNVGVVNALLPFKAKTKVTKRDRDGNTILHYAALSSGNTSIVGDILHLQNVKQSFRSLVNVPNKHGETPLHFAAEKGNVQAVQDLLGIEGTSRCAEDEKGATPFHRAAQTGQTRVMPELKLHDLNKKAANGKTALHFAAAEGHTEAVNWLLREGAMVGEEDNDGNTPLHSAVWHNRVDTVKCLVEARAPLCCLNRKGLMPVSYCKETALTKEMMRALLDHSPDVLNIKVRMVDRNRSSVLHFAAAYANPQQIEWLLKRGACPAQRDKLGDTPLHYTAREGNASGAKTLVEMTRRRLSLDAENKAESRQLDVAATNKAKEKRKPVDATNEANAEQDPVDATNNAEQTPLWYAVLNKREELVRYFFHESEKEAVKSIVAALIIDVKRKDYESVTFYRDCKVACENLPPCYLALHTGREEIFHFLSKFSKGMVKATTDRAGFRRTSLHWAVLSHDEDAVSKLLAEEDLKATAKDKHGISPLCYAYKYRNKQIQQKLLKREDVKSEVKSHYSERQTYVDASNAVLVGGALIAGVTFSGWLQPPLGYTQYYDLPLHFTAAPPGSFESYAAVEQHRAVWMFWIFNSLSFFFAMASVLAGTAVMIPNQHVYIGTQVKHKRFSLYWAALWFVLSVVLVTVAFATAGFAALPPLHEYLNPMRNTVIAGGVVFGLTMCIFGFMFYQFIRAVGPLFLEPVVKLARQKKWCTSFLLKIDRCIGVAEESENHEQEEDVWDVWDSIRSPYLNQKENIIHSGQKLI